MSIKIFQVPISAVSTSSHSEQRSQARQSRWYCRNRWESRSVPNFIQSPFRKLEGLFCVFFIAYPKRLLEYAKILTTFVNTMGTQLDSGIKPYNHYGAYLKNKYNGQKVFKVIVDGNFTCPNRDGSKGYGGCTYCNVDSFTPDTARKIPTIREQVESGIARARNSYGAEKFIIY